MVNDAQLSEKAANQPCVESKGVNPLFYDPDKEYTTLPNGVIRISPKNPPYEISDRELTATLFEIPYGKVVREEDLCDWLQRKHHVKAVRLDYGASMRNWNRPDIPYWRVVSQTGLASGVLYPRGLQKLKLESEGITLKQVNRSYERVLGIEGIDNYIRYGGTMSLGGKHYNETSTFVSKRSTDEYVDSAIARNIQHSLEFYQYGGHFRQLIDLYDKGELTSAINRVVEDINHRFTIDVLTRDFVSNDLGISAKNLRKDRTRPTKALDQIDKEAFTEGLRKALEIINKSEQTVAITDAHRTEIKEYLDLLDLTVDIPTEFLPVSNKALTRTAVSQPGLRYAQAEALIRQLLLDEQFQNISAVDRGWITERILDEIRGRMMEDIVLLETRMARPDKHVFRMQFTIGEFDMMVADLNTPGCEAYEIKHSTEAVPAQYRFLDDPEKLKATEFRYGPIRKRIVIHRGPSMMLENGIEYMNVEEYLKGL